MGPPGVVSNQSARVLPKQYLPKANRNLFYFEDFLLMHEQPNHIFRGQCSEWKKSRSKTGLNDDPTTENTLEVGRISSVSCREFSAIRVHCAD
jgi:hypothetical protein